MTKLSSHFIFVNLLFASVTYHAFSICLLYSPTYCNNIGKFSCSHIYVKRSPDKDICTPCPFPARPQDMLWL